MFTTQDNSLESELRRICAEGAPGHRLPSVRELQRRYSVSPVTVQHVVRQLVMEGRAVTRPGDGTFVVSRTSTSTANIDYSWQTAVLGRAIGPTGGLDHLTHERTDGTIALDNAFPDPSLQALDLLAKAATRVARQADSWDRCLPQGLARLRQIFAVELGPAFTADDVLITPGAQAAIDSACRVLGRPGDAIAIEDPCYPGAVIAAHASGLEPTPVPTDRDGILPDALGDVLERSRARILVIQPRYANPSGSVLSPQRRRAVLDIARQFGCFVIEDDWVRDLDLDGPTGPPLIADDQHGHVISIRSLSKAAAPGLRIASVTARGPALARLVSARLAADFFVPPMVQATAAELLFMPGWQRHLAALRSALAHRRDTLLAGLATHAPEVRCERPRGGVAVWCELPPTVDEGAVVDACRARGVRVAGGRAYHLTEQATGHLRLAFGKGDPRSLTAAAERVGDALQTLARRVR